MYDIPEDCLLTYDPDYLDFHSNSTDFVDSHILKVASKSGNHSLFNRRKLFKPTSKDRTPENVLLYNSQMSKSSSKVLYETETIYDTDKEADVYKRYKNRKSQILLSENQIERKLSKRNKLIPVISGLLKRSSNYLTPRSDIKRNKVENCSQTLHSNYTPARGRFRSKQCYAVQPVCIERSTYVQAAPFQQVNNNRTQLPVQRTSRDEYFNTVCSLTSSSEVDHQMHQIIEARSRWTKQINDKKTFRESNLHRRKQKAQQEVTSPRNKSQKQPFQVYTSPQQYATELTTNSNASSGTSAVPSTCSGFWDYLFNKINNKYQKVQVYKSCKCCATEKVMKANPCSCNSRDNLTEPSKYFRELLSSSPVTTKCSCNIIPTCGNQMASENLNTPLTQQTQQTPQTATMPASPPIAKLHIPPKIQTQNTPTGDSSQPSSLQQIADPNTNAACQMKHTDLTTALNQKYNGEILCIHNPPCIVINGCLNLPPIGKKQGKATQIWPVSDSLKPSYQKIYRSKRSKKKNKNNQGNTVDRSVVNKAIEQSCQYQNNELKHQFDKSIKIEQNIINRSCQYLTQTVDQCQLTELTTEEKNIQSYCNHVPPCEVKRKCHKPKYDPIWNSNCFHVPMCDNVPVCMLNSSDMIQIKPTCRHKPRCIEVPKCSIDYLVINGKGETATQVRPKAKTVCRHDPPCIMISKCLAQMCADGYMPHDAVPSCTHRPPCEMIPACCRKTAKEMVSVCSQHPNSCRIV